jgi:pyruvate/2-oxoglutarate dehydrogenase complex dihydrolipoamide acyltransferase (E2) component
LKGLRLIEEDSMRIEIVMPKMGESIQEGTILRWLKKVGEKIKKDETFLEISTDKVDSEIPSPVTGVLIEILAAERDTVPVGSIIAYIDTDVHAGNEIGANAQSNGKNFIQSTAVELSGEPPSNGNKKQQQSIDRFYSPLVKMIAAKEGIDKADLDAIVGTGAAGRVTKKDLLGYLEEKSGNSNSAGASARNEVIQRTDPSALGEKYPSPKYNVIRMDNVQRKMAEHMMRSVSVSPHVTIVDEVDMTSIVNNRLRILEQFKKEEGFKLTYTHYIAYAVMRALKEFPIINSSVEGDSIIQKNFVNLGIAVAAPAGLMVPVVRGAEGMKFRDLSRALNDVAVRARTKKIVPDDIANGTFSITNYGVFGCIIGTPIINQPQAGILGIGAIKKRAVVMEDKTGNQSLGIRSMVYLTVTFDHRIIDGAIGGQFLSRIKWLLENYDFQTVN